MRILVVGAGSIGGYFGGRLLAAGRDVTFLVRRARAERLSQTGLVIKSPVGDLDWPAPPTITAEAISGAYDLILLSCKAYDLEGAIASFAPAVGPDTLILPLLNGMQHLDRLEQRFGEALVLGGQCVISTALDHDGHIIQFNDVQSLSFGPRNGLVTPRIGKILPVLDGAGFEARLSTEILQEMWEKWVFIAAGAGLTCLMRSTVGDIVAGGGSDIAMALLKECGDIAGQARHPLRAAAMERAVAMLTAPGSAFSASMLRDIQAGHRIEADHIVGDLLNRANGDLRAPVLRIAFAHLKTYEARRAREALV